MFLYGCQVVLGIGLLYSGYREMFALCLDSIALYLGGLRPPGTRISAF
jgi:hypothetical protein